ncbi:ATP-binding protein [Luteolibacter luteus]|uniref:ATP-binding protein n=1 Tax=Luteolibacter luteus TaxID=2728835 RepID=A0A858RIM5_9BACT|nr:ATP-binding protein [Luteolibacter luteus]QJE96431.1 ATP-binding protein [Luteolibacter luteus]
MIARENPFAPARLEKVLAFDPVLIGSTWELLESRWASLGFRGAICGRHGAGKTTLLRAWAKRLQERGQPPLRIFLNDEKRRLSPEDLRTLEECCGRILLIDGEQHLPWRERLLLRRASRHAAGKIAARWSPGSWPLICRLEPDPQLAAALLTRAAPEWVARFKPDLDRRLANCRGNLRELFLGCYDDLASQG